MPLASAIRVTYSRLLDIAAPGGGSAALATAGVARTVRQAAAAAALLSFMLPSGGKRPLPRGTIGQEPTPPATLRETESVGPTRLRRVHDMPAPRPAAACCTRWARADGPEHGGSDA